MCIAVFICLTLTLTLIIATSAMIHFHLVSAAWGISLPHLSVRRVNNGSGADGCGEQLLRAGEGAALPDKGKKKQEKQLQVRHGHVRNLLRSSGKWTTIHSWSGAINL